MKSSRNRKTVKGGGTNGLEVPGRGGQDTRERSKNIERGWHEIKTVEGLQFW